MLRGGGILYRLTSKTLSSSDNDDDDDDDDDNYQCPYKGMDKLFQLSKDIRKLKESLVRKDPTSPDVEEIQNNIQSLQEQIRALRKTLPIQSIRRDLDAHYKEYLSEFSLIVSRNGGAGRCLVDTMPTPIPQQDNDSHTYQLPPSFAPLRTVELLKQVIQQILLQPNHEDSEHEVNNLAMVGISTFHCGQLLFTQARHEIEETLSNQPVSLLMAYMASYRTKMSHVGALRHSIPNFNATTSSTGMPSSSSDQKFGFGNLALSFGSILDEPPTSTVDENTGNVAFTRQQNGFQQQRGRFLSSPPSFMMNATYQTYNIRYADRKQDIWAPMVHLLPLDLSTTDKHNIKKTHMVLFDFLQFSFLLFLTLPLADNPSTKELRDCRLFMMRLEEELTEAILLTLNVDKDDTSDGSNSTMEWTNGPGQDIILLERSQHKLVLFQDPAISPSSSRRDASKKKGDDRKRPQRRFLGFGPKRKDKIPSQPSNYGSMSLEWSALGLDCRHLLASRLPLDVCLAFDDMINEIVRRRESRKSLPEEEQEKDVNLNNSIELCTCMPYGWIYAYATGEKEIYAFFDNSIYVTVNDVQSAALRIQETFTAT